MLAGLEYSVIFFPDDEDKVKQPKQKTRKLKNFYWEGEIKRMLN